MASCRFLSPSLLRQLERRWIFLQHSVSGGTLLSPQTAELFTGFKKTERSSSKAELVRSRLLNGLPLPNGITHSNFHHGLLRPSQSGPAGLSSFLLGRKECASSHFVMMSCSFVPWCLCSWCSPYVGNLSLLSLLGELTFIPQESARMLIPGCSLFHCLLPSPRTNWSLMLCFHSSVCCQ